MGETDNLYSRVVVYSQRTVSFAVPVKKKGEIRFGLGSKAPNKWAKIGIIIRQEIKSFKALIWRIVYLQINNVEWILNVLLSVRVTKYPRSGVEISRNVALSSLKLWSTFFHWIFTQFGQP